MGVEDAYMEGSILKINITYYEDLTGKSMTIKYSSKQATSSERRLLFDSVFDFDITLRDYVLPIEPTNNLEPVVFD